MSTSDRKLAADIVRQAISKGDAALETLFCELRSWEAHNHTLARDILLEITYQYQWFVDGFSRRHPIPIYELIKTFGSFGAAALPQLIDELFAEPARSAALLPSFFEPIGLKSIPVLIDRIRSSPPSPGRIRAIHVLGKFAKNKSYDAYISLFEIFLYDNDEGAVAQAISAIADAGMPPQQVFYHLFDLANRQDLIDETRRDLINTLANSYGDIDRIWTSFVDGARYPLSKYFYSFMLIVKHDVEKPILLFYLIGCLYKEGVRSFRGAEEAIKNEDRKLHVQFDNDELPRSAMSFTNNLKKSRLREFFSELFDDPMISLFAEPDGHPDDRGCRRPSGVGEQFSDAGWRAWEWTGDFLKRHLPNDWFGFTLLTWKNNQTPLP